MKKQNARNIGIEVEKPKKACEDDKCPFHGTLPVRGKTFVGRVMTDKGAKTVIVRWEYSRYNAKYQVYERRHSKVAAYNPECIGAKRDDIVKIAECRPLSKTKKFVVIERVNKK
jgi:small subunit ribosomal protein S17